eukprot:364100-Chlamydomonas_euryale.AAC.5
MTWKPCSLQRSAVSVPSHSTDAGVPYRSADGLAADGVWVADDAFSAPVAVPADRLLRVIEADYGQRQDAVGPGNPHGEHAHDVWEVTIQLPPGIYRGPTDGTT